jgi:enamine deaminase RidA (YjgF/YER057c/UK114 family)
MSDINRIPGPSRGRSRAVEYNGFVWVVGVGAGGSVAEQTRNTLALIEGALEKAGSGKDRILEATVYLTDMATKEEMDAVWCDWLPEDGWPCRACVGAELAEDHRVEIKLIAAKK